MSNTLITLADINTVSGLSTESLTSLIPYAEAQAEALLGYLHKETKSKEIFIWDKTDVIRLDSYPINTVSEVKYKASASSEEDTYETDTYRVVVEDGLIIFDTAIPEKYIVTVTYEIGWDRTTVTRLVKLLLVALTINQYYSLNPTLTQSSQVVLSEKIGDYAIKYANLDKTFKSFDEWVDYLAMLVKKGGDSPEVHSI